MSYKMPIFIYYRNKSIIHKFCYYGILDFNEIGCEGAKALAEALKLNKNLTNLDLGIFLLLFP